MAELVIDPVAKCAHVSELLKDQNYGGATELWACCYDLLGSYYRCLAYMEADVSSIPAGSTINSASKLEIYIAHRYTDDQLMTWLRANGSWEEGTITYNNQPGGTTPSFTYTGPDADGAFTITGSDLATWLQDALDNRSGLASWVTYPVALPTAESGFRFNSDDAALYKPKFTVVYAPPAVGPYLRPNKYLGC
jgi:hypothetical protein